MPTVICWLAACAILLRAVAKPTVHLVVFAPRHAVACLFYTTASKLTVIIAIAEAPDRIVDPTRREPRSIPRSRSIQGPTYIAVDVNVALRSGEHARSSVMIRYGRTYATEILDLTTSNVVRPSPSSRNWQGADVGSRPTFKEIDDYTSRPPHPAYSRRLSALPFPASLWACEIHSVAVSTPLRLSS